MCLVSPEHLGHTGKLLPRDRKSNPNEAVLKRTLLTTSVCEFEKMENEKVLNAALIKKSPNFYEKYYRQQPPARSSSSSWFL
jgi:hypothetical protein